MFISILHILIATTLFRSDQAPQTPWFPTHAETAVAQFSRRASYADGAAEIIDRILETVGLAASFEVRKANVPNAAAVVYEGKRYILYNPSFIVAMDKAAGTPWAAVAILAHEIGHHLNGHTLDGKGSQPAIELEADEFSGFALRKMGASLSEAQVAMRIIAGTKPTRTHPARSDRLLAIANGWNQADDQLNELEGGRRPSFPSLGPSKESLLPAMEIAFDVYFTFDPNTKYYVTVRNNLLKLLNNGIYIVGKLLSTGKSLYPLAFQTGPGDFLLISRTGKIINEHGKPLGRMTPRN